MIINTGSRTDIPAFYPKWLINRIREGFVYVRNPYNPDQVTKYILDPNVVDCLAFCTKNPEPILKYIDEIDKFKQYWFVTITSYGKDIEPNVPDKEDVINSFIKLSNHVGINSVGWRYDPIFIGMGYDIDYHIKSFSKMANKLKGYTHDCTISFLDLYEKVKKNAPNIKPPNKEEQIKIAKAFYKIGKENDIVIHSCCEKDYLADYGLDITGCMSREIVEKSIGCKLKPPAGKSVRGESCNCLMGNDIGAYNTCKHGCIYCYANSDNEAVKYNVQKHIQDSPFLVGSLEAGDKIHVAEQKSWKIEFEQISFI